MVTNPGESALEVGEILTEEDYREAVESLRLRFLRCRYGRRGPSGMSWPRWTSTPLADELREAMRDTTSEAQAEASTPSV